MAYSSLIAIITTVVFLALLGSLASDPAIDTAARHVLDTAFWALTAGTLTQSTCIIAAYNLGFDYSQSSCAPYTFTVAAVAARMQVFGLGGYGRREWEVILQFPSRSPELLQYGAARSWQIAKDSLERLELTK